jgi:ribosome-binding protein aMBF1 (putative translation factor)
VCAVVSIEETLRAAIIDSGLSDSELGRRAQVSQSIVQRYRSGARRCITSETFAKIADALGFVLVKP